MKVPERIYANNFTGTWIGGDFTLRYQTDGGAHGACPMEIYYMSTGYGASGFCKNGHIEVSRLPGEESGLSAGEPGAVDQPPARANQE